MNYYNEIELSARRWLRELIKDGLIPDGYIDNRPIQEVRAEEITKGGFTQCHFFAGIGGWPLALRIAGVPDDEPLWTGSCPCQPFSDSGERLGFADSRHLFPAWRRLIARCNPAIVFGEQVSSKLGREWFARVRLEMASLGYATRGGDICSAGVAAPNRRQRLYWVADTTGSRHPRTRQSTIKDGNGSDQNAFREVCGCATTGGSCAGPLAHPDMRGSSERRGQPASSESESGDRIARLRGAADPTGVALGDTDNPRRERRRLRFVEDTGQQPPWEAGAVGLLCADGKTRRINPKIFPLAARLPGDLGLIRGAGNAINPWVAAKFIRDSYP